MVQIRWLFLLSVVAGCTSAINIAQLLGFADKDEPKEVPQAPEQVPSEDRQLLQQLGAMAAPLIPFVDPFVSIAPNVASQIRPTVTRTLFIQVTSTHVKFPVCVTAHGVRPPCAALAAPSVQESQHHEEHNNPHDAYLVGHNQAILGYEIEHSPQLGLVGHVPQPEGYFEDDHHNEEEGWEYRDTGEIQPTAALRMPESSAMLELARFERNIDSSLTPDEEIPESVVRPHPRYLISKKHPPPHVPAVAKTVTKTLYMTKVEKHTNHHVTATMVAKNCIPDHLPLCPTQSHPSLYTSQITEHKPHGTTPNHHTANHHALNHQTPVHHKPSHHAPNHPTPNHTPNHHVPNHHVPEHHAPNHTPNHHVPNHHVPEHHTPNHHPVPPHHHPAPHYPAPVHPLQPGHWNGKDAASAVAEDKKDNLVPPTEDTPKEA